MNTIVSEARQYTNTISKGSALLEETKILLRAWQPGESLNEFCERVLREDLLGRMTAYRARDIVRRVFARRYFRPDNKPALLLKRLLERNQSGQLFSDLCLLYASRNDDLIRDVVTGLLKRVFSLLSEFDSLENCAVHVSIKNNIQFLDRLFWKGSKLRLVRDGDHRANCSVFESYLQRLADRRHSFEIALDG